MKNSAWYTKLWRKKLDNLPVKGDAGAAWAKMQQMLDVHLPVNAVPASPVAASKPLIAKIISLSAYVLPAAAMIGAATWFAVKPQATEKLKTKPVKMQESFIRSKLPHADSLSTDSLQIMAGERQVIDTSAKSFNADSLLSANSKVADKQSASASDVAQKAAVQPEGGLGNQPNSLGANPETAQPNPTSGKMSGAKSTNSNATKLGGDAPAKRVFSKPTAKYTVRGGDAVHDYSGRNNDASNQYIGSNNNAVQPNGKAKQVNAVLPKQLTNYADAVYSLGIPIEEEAPRLVYQNQASGNVMQGDHSLAVDGSKLIAGAGNNPKADLGTIPKNSKSAKNSLPKVINTPTYNFGLEGGLNLANGIGYYGGVAANYAVTNRLLIGAGVRLNSVRTLTGSYTHPSFYRPDSSQAFTITEVRKIRVIDVPLMAEYRLNNLISLKAGAVIGFAGKPNNVSYQLSGVGSTRDTLRKTGAIDSTVNSTVLGRKVSLGFTGGVGLHVGQFTIDARYLALPPYKLNNTVGGYSQSYNPFQIGISYWFRSGQKKAGK